MRFTVFVFVLMFLPRSLLADVDAPLVAVSPATLLRNRDQVEREGAPLSERVQLEMQNTAEWRFVERVALDSIIREQTTALEGGVGETTAVRIGRLSHADWILRLRLRADDFQRPRIEAEVIDALRADLLARVEIPLADPPNESWLLLPDDSHVELATAAAVRALRAARDRVAKLAGRTIVAPLTFINRSGTERLAPLGPALQTALRADRPGVRVLAYDSPAGAITESTLFLSGLTDLRGEAWARIADVYVWGEYEEAGAYDGPVADLPVKISLQVWREGSAPLTITRLGTLGKFEDLASSASDAVIIAAAGAQATALGHARVEMARRLLATAREIEADALRATLPDVTKRRLLAACQTLGLALFFDPSSADLPAAWRDLWARLSLPERNTPMMRTLARSLADLAPPPEPLPSPRPPDSSTKSHTSTLRRPPLDDASRYNSAFTAWENAPFEVLLDRAESGTLARKEALELPWMEFSPWDVLTPKPRRSRKNTGAAILECTADSLWFSPSWAVFFSEDPEQHSVYRLDWRAGRAEQPPLAELADVQVSGVLARPDGLWFSTRGKGILIYDTKLAHTRSIGAAEGLPSDDQRWLLDGRDAVFVVGQDLSDPRVIRIDSATGRVDQITPPSEDFLPGLRPASRAAIASFGDDATPTVKLPGEPTIFCERPDLLRQAFRARALRERKPAAPPGPWRRHYGANRTGAHVLTGARDGYWVASSHAVIWASGNQRRALAGWIDGWVVGLADDGRHLFIQIERNDAEPRPGFSKGTYSSEDLRTYVYDHRTGKWVGHFFVPYRGGMKATAGVLMAHDWDKPTLLIADTSAFDSPSPGGHRAAMVSALGLTATQDGNSLHAALWERQPERVRELLRRGVSAHAPDTRGVAPLSLAAGWSSPGCLDVLLKNVEFDQATLDLALRAAILRQRPEIQRLLLEAGAVPPVAVIKPLPAAVPAARQGPSLEPSQTPSQRLSHLVNAYEEPDLAAIQAALTAGADPCFMGKSGRKSVLLEAAENGKFSAVEVMLTFIKAENLNKPDNQNISLGLNAMKAALTAKRPDIAHALVAAGTKLTPSGDAGDFDEKLTSLAIASGDAKLVGFLLRAGFPGRTKYYSSLLRDVVAQKNAPLLALLLTYTGRSPDTLNVDDSSGNGRTALFEAADLGWAEGVAMLLQAGATRDTCDLLEKRHIHEVSKLWPEVAVLLNQRPGAAENQLAGASAVAALWKNQPGALDAVVITAEVMSYRDFLDWTVLHHAAAQGRTEFVRRLVKAGAPTDGLTTLGRSVLCMAAIKGDLAAVETLLRAGADPNRRGDGFAWLPLHAAAEAGRADLVRLLLDAGANPQLCAGEREATALYFAAMAKGNDGATRLLVEAGTPLNGTDREGFGMLEAAVVSDSPERIQYLLDHGARWTKRFTGDYHPMDVAAERGLTGSIRKLQQLGLQSSRAFSLAKNDITRAVLQDDQSEAGRRFLADEEKWPLILTDPDPDRRRERVLGFLETGANPNHLSAKWGTPLDLATARLDLGVVRLLIARGANPAIQSTGVVNGRYPRKHNALHALLWPIFSQSEPLPIPPGFDDFLLECLPLVWPYEPDPEVREEMLEWAQRGDLVRAAAWMREHR